MASQDSGSPALSTLLPPLILGGGVYNTQMNEAPYSLPVRSLVVRAFSMGMNAVDTSPYYGPSEEILGDALRQREITDSYPRSSYFIMTKAGRKALEDFDYSPGWIRSSVERSISRLCPEQRYVDVVFLHDIEFVTLPEVLGAMKMLLELVREQKVRYVGISGYPLPVLLNTARAIREEFGRSVDIVQSYGHANLQNSTLIDDGWTRRFRAEAGVDVVLNASPLNMKLLSGVEPGDFHPAPRELIQSCLAAGKECRGRGTSLPRVAMRYALARWLGESQWNGGGVTVTGVSFVDELEDNIAALKDVTKAAGNAVDIRQYRQLDEAKVERLIADCEEVRKVLGRWVGYEWKSPPEDWFTKRDNI